MAETEKPAMSRCNLNIQVMKNSLTKIVKQMEVLQENEQGQLKGGFASMTSLYLKRDKEKNKVCPTNTCTNQCTNNC